VFAMGRIFSGSLNAIADQDLDGIVFPTTRAGLRFDRQDASRDRDVLLGGNQSTLFALGEDAWNIFPWLPAMARDPQWVFPGEVGNLTLNSEGRLVRQPIWAVFTDGRPVEIENNR